MREELAYAASKGALEALTVSLAPGFAERLTGQVLRARSGG